MLPLCKVDKKVILSLVCQWVQFSLTTPFFKQFSYYFSLHCLRQIFLYIVCHNPIMQQSSDPAISSKEIPSSHTGNGITGS